ncbi:hypothetical protein [Rhodococcus opacus]|uniref:hypothetical protein n=1 Tax=Rhodococcus opacus TaxID=37919 RepID=UPI0011D0D502|nr:hypothetical protein [Rhodococcus opacus]
MTIQLHNLQTVLGWFLVAVVAFCAIWPPVPTKRRAIAGGLAIAGVPALLSRIDGSHTPWEMAGFGIALCVTAWALAPVIFQPSRLGDPSKMQ